MKDSHCENVYMLLPLLPTVLLVVFMPVFLQVLWRMVALSEHSVRDDEVAKR